MPAFVWDEHFITGLGEVDEQHQNLVEKINAFGALISSNSYCYEELSEIVDQLAQYAVFHFQEEEELMKRSGIDPSSITQHISAHSMFTHEVASLKATLSPNDNHAASYLLNFLTHWLAFHILGEDQLMALQMKFIEEGMSAKDAHKAALEKGNDATEPLLKALSGLFHQVSQRNKELKELNETLEEKVAERTSQLEKANEELEELALTDVLTGLPNRRHAMKLLNLYWQESQVGCHNLSCMMLDADHFKEVNDTYGHDCGDIVLIELSKCLQGALRTDDLIARLGGDEFLIVCPNTRAEGAIHLANTLLKKVQELKVATGDGHWEGSVSIGVATTNEQMKGFEALIKAADEKVYESKRNGKNRVSS